MKNVLFFSFCLSVFIFSFFFSYVIFFLFTWLLDIGSSHNCNNFKQPESQKINFQRKLWVTNHQWPSESLWNEWIAFWYVWFYRSNVVPFRGKIRTAWSNRLFFLNKKQNKNKLCLENKGCPTYISFQISCRKINYCNTIEPILLMRKL